MQHEPDDETQEGLRAWLWVIACCAAAVIVVLGLAYWRSL
jgi:hypothetical protein